MTESSRFLTRARAEWLVLALVLLVIAGTDGYDLYRSRERLAAVERDRLVHNADVVAGYIDRHLQQIGAGLDLLRGLVRTPSGKLDFGAVSPARLDELAVTMGGVSTVTIVNADTAVVASTATELVGRSFRGSDRDLTLRAGPDPRILYVFPPYRTSLGKYTISVAKVLQDERGQFGGFVFVGLDPWYFDTVLKSGWYGPEDLRFGLVHGDGKVVYRIPVEEGLTGVDLSASPESLFMRHRQSGQPASVIAGISAGGGENRLSAFRTIDLSGAHADKPLVVYASRVIDAVFAPWQREFAIRATFFAALTAVSTLGLALAQRRRRKLLRLAEALEEERVRGHEQLQLATDGAQIGIWYWTPPGEKQEWSDRCRALLALPDDQEPSLEHFYSVLHPDDRERIERQLLQAIENREEYAAEYRIVHPDGIVRWISALGRVYVNPDGSLRGMGGILIDISTAKEHERELQEARTVADAASRAKGEFLAHMSHEIRTPMNAVINIAQLLHAEALTPEQRELVGIIEEAGQSLLRIINDILDFSKIEAGQLPIEKRPFELAVLLSRVESLLHVAAETKGLRLTVISPSEKLRALVGDALRLEQVLVNLINNAIKFTAKGGITLTVMVQHESANNVDLRFEVRDTGIGIAPDVIARLFTPFTQANIGITRRFGGTGLGLSICKRVVELMGGRIGVTSELGQGSTFWFELSFAWAAEEIRTAAPAREPRPTNPQLVGLRVLAADDSKMNLLIVDRILKSEGATTVFAADGQQALQILQANPRAFDVVLMDVQMPVMDGLTATRAIRADPALAAIPVVALTAGVLEAERERAIAAGVNDFLPKPLDRTQMIDMLSSFRAG